MYNDKYIKTKISLNTYFYNNKMPRENEHYTCLSVISLYSMVNIDIKYYPQVFLRECKYAEKRKR